MKKFREVLSETSRGGGGMQPQYGRYAVGYSPSVISKINAIIGRYCIEELVDPYSAIYRIRGSLNNLGLLANSRGDLEEAERLRTEFVACYVQKMPKLAYG